jgi:hypothetical protein
MKVWIMQFATVEEGEIDIGVTNIGAFSSLDRVWDFIVTNEMPMGRDWWQAFRFRRYHEGYYEGRNEETDECVLIYTMELDNPTP